MRGKQGCVCLSLQSYQDKFRVKRWVHDTMDSLGRRLKAPSALEGWFRDTWSLGNRLQCSITLEEFREYQVCCGWDQGIPDRYRAIRSPRSESSRYLVALGNTKSLRES